MPEVDAHQSFRPLGWGRFVAVGKKPLVYFIDDQADIRDAARLLLESDGIDVQTYASGDAFLDAIRTASAPPDCIISDLRVSDASGADILDVLGASDSHIPVIILTADPSLLGSRTLDSRFVAVFTKPADPEKLLEAVRSASAR